jgi:hypothetical protein
MILISEKNSFLFINLLFQTLAMFAAVLPGCHGDDAKPGEQDNRAELGRETADEITGILLSSDPKMMLVNKDIPRIGRYVKQRVDKGDIRPLASLVLSHGPWKEHIWYPYAEADISRQFATIPLNIPEKSRLLCLETLRTIARSGRSRNARVLAAAALVRPDPELAKKVLVETYGQFTLYDGYDSLYDVPIEPSGKYLGLVNCHAPEEITDRHQAERILRTNPRFFNASLDRSALVAAANAMNHILTEALAKGDGDTLQKYVGHPPLAAKLGELYLQQLEREGDSVVREFEFGF